MCLSSVFEVRDGHETLVCEHVSGVTADGGSVTLTDIMGVETVVMGAVTNIDLVKNIILIAS
jgi:predicted RNA-binding protein